MGTLIVDMKTTLLTINLTRFASTLILAVIALFVFSDKAFALQACNAVCTSDSDCFTGNFCHKTIDWGAWQEGSVSSLPGDGGISGFTGWNTDTEPTSSAVKQIVRGGKVYTYLNNEWDSGDDFSDCVGTGPGTCGQNPIPAGTGTAGIPNPVVGYNTTVITGSSGIKFLKTHLVRTDGIYERLQEFESGATVEIWMKSSALNNLKAQYGTPGNWHWLGFDSGVKYQDGRQQQRLIIAKVDSNTGRYTETKVLSRIQDNNSNWGPWRLAATSTPDLENHGLGGSGAQGLIIALDSAYDASQNKYTDSLIRWYWNGSYYVAQYWERTANAGNTTSVCRPEVHPESCQLPGYIPAAPTAIPSPNPTINVSGIPIPQNVSAQVACTQGQATFSWTMPANQENYEIGFAKFEYCLKNSGNQNTCTNPQGYQIANTSLELSGATKYARNKALSNIGLAKGQSALVRLRLSPEEVFNGASGIVYGNASNYITIRYSGPEGDFDNDCGVDVADYNDIITQLFDEIDHVLTDNWGLFLLNKVMRNFGTSS